MSLKQQSKTKKLPASRKLAQQTFLCEGLCFYCQGVVPAFVVWRELPYSKTLTFPKLQLNYQIKSTKMVRSG